MEEKCFL